MSSIVLDEKQKFMKEQLTEFSEVINAVPTGQRIPSTWEPPEGYRLEKIELEHVVIEHLIPLEKTTDRVIFHTHGGGYIVALIDTYRDTAVEYSKLASGAEVYSVDYRVAPTDVYPAALEDAVAAYQWVLEQGHDSKDIIFIGDSAGGNLDLVTTLYLKDHNMPLPGAVIAISPWGDFNPEVPSRIYNQDKDLVLGTFGLEMGKELHRLSYLADGDMKDPYASPVHGDYAGFPPLLIQIGTYEILYDDAKVIIQKAKEAGVKAKLGEYEGMCHDFQLVLPMLEESKEAWKEMRQFIEEVFEN